MAPGFKLRKRGFVLLVTGAVVLLAYAFISDRAPSQALPDGSRLKLAKMSFGRINRFEWAPLSTRLLTPFLPKGTTSVFGYHLRPAGSYQSYTSTNILSVWFIRDQTTDQNGSWHKQHKVVGIDEDGKRGQGFLEGDWGSDYCLQCQLPTFFKGRFISLEIFQRTNETSWVKVAEFKVKNPIPKDQRE